MHEPLQRTPTQHHIELVNADLCYFEWEGDQEKTVLLLHATGFHARCWDKTVDKLPPNTRVIALDMRGHGRSSKAGPFEWADFGEDTVAFIDAINLRNIVVAGHSMGGHCAVYAAANRPSHFRALVLVDPVILAPDQYVSQEHGLDVNEHPVARRRNKWQTPSEMFARFKDRHPFSLWREDVLHDYCDYGVLPDDDGFKLACPPEIEAQIYLGTSQRDIYHLLNKVIHPTVVMRAKPREGVRQTMDFAASPTWPGLASALPSARDCYLPELSHFIPMQRPDLVAAEILAARL
ncbi:MAG: alpha/beta hydrolase [Gammaproteobacteria bacterium]|nr:alpha/beta hydrolase [Gammaproteobacteria bacterium]